MFLGQVYPWVDFSLYFFLPSTVIAVLNVLILRALRHARTFQKNAQGGAACKPIVV
jgi:hypothetical protein